MEREFSFLLDGDRVRGRFDRVDIVPARRRARRSPAGPHAGDPATRSPTSSSRRFHATPEQVSITDYKSSDVRDPAKARQRAKDSLQLSIYAMGYEAMTGRLPDAVALHFLETGLVGPAPIDRKRIEKAREAIRTAAAPGSAPRDFDRRARPDGVQLLRLPRDLPGERRPLTGWPPLDDADARGDRRRRSRGGARGGGRGGQPRRSWLPCPTGSVDLPTRTRRSRTGETHAGWCRSGPADGDADRDAGSGGREYRLRGGVATSPMTTACRWTSTSPRCAPGSEAIHRVLAPHGSLYLHVDWRTVHHVRLLLDEVFGAGPVPQRARLGLRLRRAAARPLAAQARHDPVVRAGRPWLFDRDAIDRVPYLAPGLVGPEKAARGKLPDRRVVDDDRAAGLRRSGPATRPRSRCGSWSGSSRRRAGPGDLVLDPYAGSRDDRRRRRAPRPALAARGSRARSPWRSPAARLAPTGRAP